MGITNDVAVLFRFDTLYVVELMEVRVGLEFIEVVELLLIVQVSGDARISSGGSVWIMYPVRSIGSAKLKFIW